MNKKIWLSYSTLSHFEKAPHSWIVKQLGIVQPETPEMTEGKEAHKVFIDHVTGKKKDPRVTVDLTFKQGEYKAFHDYNKKYGLFGFCDAVDFGSKSICEYKTSSTVWSQQKFNDLKQIPFYSLLTGFRKVFMVTSTRDMQNFKTFYKEISDKEIENIQKWVDGLVKKLDKGEYTTDLVDGRCQGNCYYKSLCYFA